MAAIVCERLVKGISSPGNQIMKGEATVILMKVLLCPETQLGNVILTCPSSGGSMTSRIVTLGSGISGGSTEMWTLVSAVT